jgi:hypothetical protein
MCWTLYFASFALGNKADLFGVSLDSKNVSRETIDLRPIISFDSIAQVP